MLTDSMPEVPLLSGRVRRAPCPRAGCAFRGQLGTPMLASWPRPTPNALRVASSRRGSEHVKGRRTERLCAGAHLRAHVECVTDGSPASRPAASSAASLRCLMRRCQSNTYTLPGSNWRPSACWADVIATRPRVPCCIFSPCAHTRVHTTNTDRGAGMWLTPCSLSPPLRNNAGLISESR